MSNTTAVSPTITTPFFAIKRDPRRLYEKAGNHSSLHDKVVGKFFHSVNPQGEIEWQGRVLAEPVFGRFECQLYEWIMGEPSDVLLVPAATVKDWKFYDSVEAWRAAYAVHTQSL